MDLSQINLAEFAAPNRSNNETISKGRALQSVMTQFGMPTATLYAIAGSVTASADALVAAGVDPDKDKVYLFLSLDAFDADADQPEYVAPINDLNVAKMLAEVKGKSGLNAALRWAELYGQVVKVPEGVTPPTPMQRILDSVAVQLAVNDAANKALAKLLA